MKKNKKGLLSSLGVVVVALLIFLAQSMGILPASNTDAATQTSTISAQAEQTEAVSAKASKTTAKHKATATPASDAALTPTPIPEGPIIDPQSIADYLFAHGELPDNFITKKEAQALGWDSSYNDVSDVAPGMSIGGDHFGNYENKLPTAKGRKYYECDCYYTTGNRNAYRIIYSNDGLVYYTDDHYNTFTQMQPSTGY